MSGLMLIFIIVLWIIVVKRLTIFLSQWIPASKYDGLFKGLLFAMLLVMPFMDEIIGMLQFKALCSSETVVTYDETKVRGKTVHLKSAEVIYFTNTVLPTYKQTWRYAEHASNKELFSFVELHSDGGWLSRWIRFNGSHSPYTFNGVCNGNIRSYIFQNFHVKLVNKE